MVGVVAKVNSSRSTLPLALKFLVGSVLEHYLLMFSIKLLQGYLWDAAQIG
ncbi:MAG: hypothetical protein HC936_01250 [Leptolyngbyaceae cyanobacterium SU_3_3]|nr:hypothetical protein [Leptolyngbyaceae cyanobacterium SU_3_3]